MCSCTECYIFRCWVLWGLLSSHPSQTDTREMKIFLRELKPVYQSRHLLLCCVVSLIWWFIYSGFSVKAVTKNNDELGKRQSYLDMTAVYNLILYLMTIYFFVVNSWEWRNTREFGDNYCIEFVVLFLFLKKAYQP